MWTAGITVSMTLMIGIGLFLCLGHAGCIQKLSASLQIFFLLVKAEDTLTFLSIASKIDLEF